MSLERRGNRTVYYRARRENGRIVKEYVGSGLIALLSAQLDAIERADRKAELETAHSESRELDRADAELAELDHLIETALNGAGLHRPKRGRWRQRR